MIKQFICLSCTVIAALAPAVSADGGLPADFSSEGTVNFKDFDVLANAWLTTVTEPGWNPVCDISVPADDKIDESDLTVFAGYWLQHCWPYGPTTRVSLSSTGQQANNGSGQPGISGNGRYVAFRSRADNLVEGDTNGYGDIFVHDRQTGETSRVSISSTGEQGNDYSGGESIGISAEGRYVAFESEADNLVEEDTNYRSDIFVHDRQTGETSRVSVSSAGEQGNQRSNWPGISADGRYVVFHSYATNLSMWDPYWGRDVFVHDRQTSETSLVSVSTTGFAGNNNSECHGPGISTDGRYVAFISLASDLVDDDTNGWDVFVRDRQTQQTIRVSVSSTGEQGNGQCRRDCGISADGRYVTFKSYASNLVEDDTNGYEDIFVHDCQTGQTSRVSVSSTGRQGDGPNYSPDISADGRYAAFYSGASNLVEADTNGATDIFVHDCQTGRTSRVNVSSTGQQANKGSSSPSISADGRYVAFTSYASNLVEVDTNEYHDVFVHDCFGY